MFRTSLHLFKNGYQRYLHKRLTPFNQIKSRQSNLGGLNTSKLDMNKMTRNKLKQLSEFNIREKRKFRQKTFVYYSTSIAIFFLGLCYTAVPLYRAICARTGFSGIPITDRRKFTKDKLIPVETGKRIKVSFTSEVSQILPWKFVPEQRQIYVLPGETALTFYKAYNKSDKDIIGMATYSITPGEAAKYFNKIQCFCFEEQKLSGHEDIDMPVFFFIDPDFASDPAMRNIEDIVLHYTFFKAHYGDGTNISDLVSKGEPISREETDRILQNVKLLQPEVEDTRVEQKEHIEKS